MILVAEIERVYQSMFEEALIGIAQTSLSGRFLRVNPHLCDLLGYTHDELAALDFAAVSHPDEVEDDLDAKRALVAGDMHRYSREKRYRTKAGTYCWTQLTVSLHRGPDGEPAYFIAIVEDITNRRNLEQQLRQTQKMEAIGRLAGGIAHDFNNLLTAIVGYSELVLKQVAPDDPLYSDIQEIRRAGHSAASLTRQLLAFSRMQVLHPQILDLNAIVSRMNTLLRRLIGEEIRLEQTLAQRLDRVRADPGRVEQVVLNLALNARDAMPRGGTLSIETANVQLDAAYVAEHPGSTPGLHVMLAIRDTGIGMDRTVLEHLFEPFYTTKELGKGTGLGLATVYGIVKQSGGSIEVRSQPGQGTTFRILLPRADSTGDMPHAEPLPVVAGGTETILLVEDEREVRVVIREVLTRHGYRVISAASGAEALEATKRHAGGIDLLLTDVVMPGMNGRELGEAFLALEPRGRVLFMSGYTDEGVGLQGIVERRVAAYIQKPFAPHVLLQKIRELLGSSDAPT
jgi:two-component system cell cycle sensor histidine kinase/response regulator CckA